MMHSTIHLCFSGLPSCSGAAPCVVCTRFILDKVVPRAMFLAGPPFNADANAAALFMRAYAQALREGGDHALQHFQAHSQAMGQQEQSIREASPPQAAQVTQAPAPVMTELEYLYLFQQQLVEGIKTMTPEHRALMAKGVSECTLEGWQQLTEPEKNIMRQIFCPAAAPQAAAVEIPEDEPLPSNESAIKVVEAMKRGTLSATTLDPTSPLPETAEPPVGVAVAPPAEQALGKSPPQASPEGHAVGFANGSEQSGSAQVAASKESSTS